MQKMFVGVRINSFPHFGRRKSANLSAENLMCWFPSWKISDDVAQGGSEKPQEKS